MHDFGLTGTNDDDPPRYRLSGSRASLVRNISEWSWTSYGARLERRDMLLMGEIWCGACKGEDKGHESGKAPWC